MWNCNNCWAQNEKGHEFCPYCGMTEADSIKLHRKRERNRKIFTAMVAVAICAPIVALIMLTTRKDIRANKIASDSASFNGHLNEYAFPSLSDVISSNDIINIKPKILPIDRKKMEVDRLYYELPDELRAANSSEVGTVVWLDCTEKLVGTYGEYQQVGKGYAYDCTVIVNDNLTSPRVWTKVFEGYYPPGSIKGGGDRYGEKPYDEIIAYLKGKPWREPHRFKKDTRGEW